MANDVRSQLNATLTNIQTFMINPAFPIDNVQMFTWRPGRYEAPLPVHGFLEAAEPAAAADVFPVIHLLRQGNNDALLVA